MTLSLVEIFIIVCSLLFAGLVSMVVLYLTSRSSCDSKIIKSSEYRSVRYDNDVQTIILGDKISDCLPVFGSDMHKSIGTFESIDLPKGVFVDATSGRIHGIPEFENNLLTEYSARYMDVNFDLRMHIKLRILKPRYPLSNSMIGDISSHLSISPSPIQKRTNELHYFTIPALPSYLTIDNETGEISGFSNAKVDAGFKILVFHNNEPSNSFDLHIKISPTQLDSDGFYPAASFGHVRQFLSIQPFRADFSSTYVFIEPELPVGLICSLPGCVVSGTPTRPTAYMPYVLTTGMGIYTIYLGILESFGSAAIYENVRHSFRVGDDINITPITQASGSNLMHSVDPPLPEGITINQSDGSIVGVGNFKCRKTMYVVTSQNEAGHTEAYISIEIVDAWIDRWNNLEHATPFSRS